MDEQRKITPPEPIIDPVDLTIRFRVVDEVRGLWSRTWSVVGNNRNGDVYVGMRDQMGEQKLSLHPREWRLAYTSEAAQRFVADGEDRVLGRWAHTPELSPGWQRGVTIVIAESALSDRTFAQRKARIASWTTPNPGWGLRFDVLLGTTGGPPFIFRGAGGKVGEFSLASGRAVGVAASEHPVDPEEMARLRALARTEAGELITPVLGVCWGTDNDDHGPVAWDIGYVDEA